MKLEVHHSLNAAEQVLSILHQLVENIKIPDRVYFVVESYVNCREQGYIIDGSNYAIDKRVYNFYASIAQHRSSDSVIICLGMNGSSDAKLYEPFHGNIATETVWKQARSFEYAHDLTHYNKAAHFIAEEMKTFADNPESSNFYIHSKKELVTLDK